MHHSPTWNQKKGRKCCQAQEPGIQVTRISTFNRPFPRAWPDRPDRGPELCCFPSQRYNFMSSGKSHLTVKKTVRMNCRLSLTILWIVFFCTPIKSRKSVSSFLTQTLHRICSWQLSPSKIKGTAIKLRTPSKTQLHRIEHEKSTRARGDRRAIYYTALHM